MDQLLPKKEFIINLGSNAINAAPMIANLLLKQIFYIKNKLKLIIMRLILKLIITPLN